MATGRVNYSGTGGFGRLISHLATFTMVSALAGVLLAGLALPVVGTMGLTAKAASDHFEDLPNDFSSPALPQRNTILSDDGSVIATTWGNYGNRVVVPMNEISQAMPQALVSIEDVRYFQHGGIDFEGTLRALLNDSSGGSVQGGSDIAQQYVKNVLLLEAGTDTTKQQEATEDTFSRKLTELKYAIVVEQTLTKEQILERYLNLVYFGNDAYGVEAAAEEYFSTTAAKLTVPQAAMLAAIVNSPTAFDPFNNPAATLQRRNIVIQDMTNPIVHYITPAQAAAYEKEPLGLKPTLPKNGCITAQGSAAYFCQYVQETFLGDAQYGKTEADREAMWDLGGLTIKTTMNVQDEKSSDAAIAKKVYPSDMSKSDVAAALAMVQPGTGAVKAIAQSTPMGSANKNETYIDFAADPQHDGTTGFQAGSSFKIFVGLAALEDGFNPNQVVDAPATIDDVGTQFAACVGNSTTVVWPPDVPGEAYTPHNDSNQDQQVNMTQAYAFSVNNYFIRLEEQTGLCKPAQIAQSMGVTQDSDTGTGKALLQVPAFTLGVNPITPIEMADAYATLAAQGTYCTTYVITSVTDSSGKQYGGQPHSCRQVLDPNIANEMTQMLRSVVTMPGATATGAVPLVNTRPVAGKTGTTDSGIATWFDGYTPQLATAVWTGFINWNTKSHLENIKIGPSYYSGLVFGASISAPIWNSAMTGALDGAPVEDFTAPTGNFGGNGNGNGGGNGNGNGNGNNNGNGGFLGGLFGGNGNGGNGNGGNNNGGNGNGLGGNGGF